MLYLDVNTKALEEHRTLVNYHYEEPVDRNSRDYTKDILSAIDNTDEQDTDTDPEDDERDLCLYIVLCKYFLRYSKLIINC